MNDLVQYMVEMDPNMISGIALFRLTFNKGGSVDYDYADSSGQFQPLDESEWGLLNHSNMVDVTEAIVDVWAEQRPLGYDTVAKYVV